MPVRFEDERKMTMPRQLSEPNSPSIVSNGEGQPQELPRGLISPPQQVRAVVEQQKSKGLPDFFLGEAWQRMSDELTLQYYFEDAGKELLYRSTPQGPEVLAIGFDEIQAFVKDMPLEDQLKLQTWIP
jgi:hypothetical protein